MNILNVNMSIDPVNGGGTAMRTYKLTRALQNAGADCAILTTDCGLNAQTLESLPGIKINAIPCINRRFYLPWASDDIIARLVQTADIVHLMSHWTVLNVLVARKCWRYRTPYVVCPGGMLHIFGRSRRLKQLFNLMVGKKIIQKAAGHIAIPESEAADFSPYGIPRKKVTVIPNGIDASDFTLDDVTGFRRKFRLDNNPYIMFLGRLSYEKGPDLLIDAFAAIADSYPAHHLLIVGPDGGMGEALSGKVQTLSIEDRVHFVGFLGGREKLQALREAEMLAITSRREAMSIVALEAGACGTPVLMTDVCGFDRVAEINGGRIVPASPRGIQQGLADMLSTPAALPDMGAALEKEVMTKYTWQAVASQYLGLYKSLLSKGKL